MSSSIGTEGDLDFSVKTGTKIEGGIAYAKSSLQAGCFYWTNASFPKELHLSNNECIQLPLNSIHVLLPPKLVPFGRRELFGVSTNTSIWNNISDGKRKRGRKQFCYRHPCYLASYDEFTNQGVIFLCTTKEPVNRCQFVTVHSGPPAPSPKSLDFKPLRTEPPYSFKKLETYLNISHPLLVQIAYFQKHQSFPRVEKEGIHYNGYKPPLVSIANFATQSPDRVLDVDVISNARLKTSVALDKKSEPLFWKQHKDYHRQRLDQLKPNDNDGGGGLDDDDGSGPDDDDGRRGPNDNNGKASPGNDNNRTRPDDDTSGSGPSNGSSSIIGAGLNSNGNGGSSGQVFSLNNVENAPWGRVGDQRIGIDIPLVIEDMDLDDEMYSNDEMNLEEFVSNLDANDAPWGRIGDQRIGIDIPLVIEDMDSNSDEDMDSKSPDEFKGIDNVANDVKDESFDPECIIRDEGMDSKSLDKLQKVAEDTIDVKLESFGQEIIIIGPNQSIGDSSCDQSNQRNNTISKPYFVISKEFGECALLHYNLSIEEWRWTRQQFFRPRNVISIEGLSYQHLDFLFNLRKPVRRIFNWHTKEYIELPQPPNEPFNVRNAIMGMSVDTSVQPYAFKVIEGTDIGTRIYDSTTQSWTHRPSVPPQASKQHPRFGNANVASCKGVVYIIDNHNRIVLYDTEEDTWNRIMGLVELRYKERGCMKSPFMEPIYMEPDSVELGCMEQLCGIGSWDDRLFSSTTSMRRTFEIRELVGMTNPEWKTFDAMPEEMYSWLSNGEEFFWIDMSYSNESLLIWNDFNFSANRIVLCNLAHKTWEKLEPPQFPGIAEGSYPPFLGH